jgi:photosystem II stability/assembly factor-like uncharacterized protein
VATKSKAKRKPPRKRPVQAPTGKVEPRRVPRWLWPLATALLVAGLAVGAFLVAKDQAQSGSNGPAAAAGGLPNTPDYHSLLVAPSDPQHVWLGTHAGLYESTDGGRNWRRGALEGQDAMNLARGEGDTVWAAGHEVFAKSTDGGRTWTDVRPEGLPSLDLHGFTVDPNESQTLYAAVAGQGLYRSRDAGQSFELVTKDVGGAVMALAVTPDGRILAGDMQQGLLVSSDAGKSWTPVLRVSLMGLAINPDDANTVVATGPGILLSRDGGRTWNEVLALADGAGPVAWAPRQPTLAYAVGFDQTLYRTDDGGATWEPVT